MQEHIFEHFNEEGHHGFLEDVSIHWQNRPFRTLKKRKLLEKFSQDNGTFRSQYWRQCLRNALRNHARHAFGQYLWIMIAVIFSFIIYYDSWKSVGKVFFGGGFQFCYAVVLRDLLQCAYLYIYSFTGVFRALSNIRMENLQKLLTAIAVGYFCKGFVWNAWLNSECVWNLFLFSYLSVIHVLLYLFIHLLFHLLTSIYCICILAITPMC